MVKLLDNLSKIIANYKTFQNCKWMSSYKTLYKVYKKFKKKMDLPRIIKM